ncbi:hypothetical protein F751_2840 [Auxenochlorella protothecoides]|uniref:Uncharacterized protein n=1 Tax=Auxenochlorella protothecoides TaxID=3075 RepID=A0A087SCX7_AUXPR|nr:hypothetical protein F751_2840 [Auxenochlorella protothecoides]KFM23581.1 hypothetical protein F751_2840 [Auxenochlorella protothecoides]
MAIGNARSSSGTAPPRGETSLPGPHQEVAVVQSNIEAVVRGADIDSRPSRKNTGFATPATLYAGGANPFGAPSGGPPPDT